MSFTARNQQALETPAMLPRRATKARSLGGLPLEAEQAWELVQRLAGLLLLVFVLPVMLATALAIVRFVMNVVRAVPDLLYASLFVTLVGTGALSGILALFLFEIGVVAGVAAA